MELGERLCGGLGRSKVEINFAARWLAHAFRRLESTLGPSTTLEEIETVAAAIADAVHEPALRVAGAPTDSEGGEGWRAPAGSRALAAPRTYPFTLRELVELPPDERPLLAVSDGIGVESRRPLP